MSTNIVISESPSAILLEDNLRLTGSCGKVQIPYVSNEKMDFFPLYLFKLKQPILGNQSVLTGRKVREREKTSQACELTDIILGKLLQAY